MYLSSCLSVAEYQICICEEKVSILSVVSGFRFILLSYYSIIWFFVGLLRVTLMQVAQEIHSESKFQSDFVDQLVINIIF